MNAKDNGGPAFPVSNGMLPDVQGMTMRDYFAAKAMQGLVANSPSGTRLGVSHKENNLNYALAAYAIADAMLQSRSEANK